jgi:hypothetical protein
VALPYEPVTLVRTGAVLLGLVDERERQVYLSWDCGVQGGDLLAFRGVVRRVPAEPVVWAGAGVVAAYEAAPALMPDLGQLLRGGGTQVLDETTGELTSTVGFPVWSGPCLVEPAQSDGSNPEIGDQQVGIVPFTVTVPLALTEIRPGDLFKVTSSRDARLLTRTLVVKAVRASSTEVTREVLAFDNQGG